MPQIGTYKENAKKGMLQTAIGLLILWHYYQGLHKLMSFDSYLFWLKHTPFIKRQPQLFAFGVPIYYGTVALLLLIRKTRTRGLWMLIAGQITFIAWVLYIRTYTPYLFWPWHVFWGGKLNWFYKFLEVLIAAWLAAGVLLLQGRMKEKKQTNLYINEADHKKRQGIAETLNK